MTAVLESEDALNVISLSFQMCTFLLSLFFLFVEWNNIWLVKMSISLSPGENTLLNESKEGNILFNLLFASTIGLLKSNHCLDISLTSNNQWVGKSFIYLDSINNLMMWFGGSICVLSWNLPLSFWRWRWIGKSPAIALIPKDGKVWKAFKIQMTALLCIFLSSLSRYVNGTLL